ncbi:hypothetical protein RhiirA4_459128 [Rhizophagus irregularis]|uniref:Uncharacterized protein n=1 Tax=Rhizophagus irregularis TaxID=588596 RepID=A0A2I1GDR0_9GLOM|nr:hypothetical protein RhiirA4_459128 [Rhizophagus irregularis]
MQSDDFCDLFEERYLNWISFYTIPWVQVSLNILHSFISGTKLQININVTESCHANEIEIVNPKKYDTCQTQDQYGIRKFLGCRQQAIRRSS